MTTMKFFIFGRFKKTFSDEIEAELVNHLKDLGSHLLPVTKGIPKKKTRRKLRPNFDCKDIKQGDINGYTASETQCLICGETFEEDWVQCLNCGARAHEECADGENILYSKCDICKKE